MERPRLRRNTNGPCRVPALPLHHVPAECWPSAAKAGAAIFVLTASPPSSGSPSTWLENRAFDAHLTLRRATRKVAHERIVLRTRPLVFLFFLFFAGQPQSNVSVIEQPCAWAFFGRRPCAARNRVNCPSHRIQRSLYSVLEEKLTRH